MNFNKAVIVFEDNTSLWYLKVLQKGFRHCFIILYSTNHNYCLELNPMSNKIFINIIHKKNINSYIKNKNTIEVSINYIPQKALPFGAFTCVEFVKRIVGIDNRFIITPKKLYTTFLKNRKKILDISEKVFYNQNQSAG